MPEADIPTEPLPVDVSLLLRGLRKLPDRLERSTVGAGPRSRGSSRTGKHTRHSLERPRGGDVAIDATLRAAALRGSRRIEPQDLRRKVRHHRTPLVVAVVLDNSYSLHADRLVGRAKGFTLRLIEAAAGHGNKVALIAFKGGVPEATVALPPTGSFTRARRRLERVPLSGRTPLADALRRAYVVLRNEQVRSSSATPLAIVITDGLPTVSLGRAGDPVGDALRQARRFRRARIPCIVADAAAAQRPSCASQLARAAGGVHLPLHGLELDALGDALRRFALR